MDSIALDQSEGVLVLLAEILPGWSLSWDTDIGMWVIKNPEGLTRATDRSPYDALMMAIERLQITPLNLKEVSA